MSEKRPICNYDGQLRQLGIGDTLPGDVSVQATNVPVDASGFTGNLSTADDSVQKALVTVDGMTVGSGAGGPAPDYTPPALVWKDADEVYLMPGRYFKAGYRFLSQYQDLVNIAEYWDVASKTAVDIDATYSAGVTSGMIGGAKVNSSWYSVFMVGSGILLVLPFVRVDTIAYSADTTITPAAHTDGTTAENGFILANDVWNNYRLLLLSDTAYNGTVYTIADTVTGSPDEIHVTGDVSSEIAATEWLQLVPPASVPCLYLGVIKINASGNLQEFMKQRWEYAWPTQVDVNGNLGTSPAATDFATVSPPTATKLRCGVYMAATSSPAWVQCIVCYGTTSTSQFKQWWINTNGLLVGGMVQEVEIPFTMVGKIRNYFSKSGVVAADTGQFRCNGFVE